MLVMAETPKICGDYIGRTKIREGMEASLTPVERKKIIKNEEVCPLILNSDGTFNHKKTTSGRYEVKGNRIFFKPEQFNGVSLQAMKQAADQAGRSFGLAWLFDPFELQIDGESLVSGQPSAVIYTEYLRKSS